MPIYEFKPIDLSHPDWETSTHKGRCRVHAPDETNARALVSSEFFQAVERKSPHQDTRFSPWPNPERVECVGTEDVSPPDYREGLIKVHKRRPGLSGPFGGPIGGMRGGGRWVSVNEDRLPNSDPRTRSSGYANQTLPRLEQSAHVNVGGRSIPVDIFKIPLPITEATIRHVVANRSALVGYTRILHLLLNDLIGPEGVAPDERNLSVVETLSLPPDTDEESLLTLLKELRDELRTFREALNKYADDPVAAMSPSLLEQLREVGIAHLNALATNKVFVSTIGATLGMSLWSLLERAGLIETKQAETLLKLILDAVK